jgi:hypothetical protein
MEGWTIYLDIDNDRAFDEPTASAPASVDVPKTIADFGTVASQMLVAGLSCRILDVNVGLDITHTNDEHLKAATPEDHTPFSVTGWPGPNKRWRARGVDVMPRSGSYAHRKENADIARQLIRDRDAGVDGAMWIKYINWTDENGTCRQERWMNAAAPLQRTTRSSTDKGHIHISGRSDVDDDARADTYDPIRRMAGVTTLIGAPMGQQMIVYGFGSTAEEQAQHWIVDGMHARRVPLDYVYGDDGKGVDGPVTNVQTHAPQFLGQLGNGGQPFRSGGDVRAWGQPIGEEIHLSPEDVAALGKVVADELRDRDAAAPVTAADIADLLAARLQS